MVGRIILNAPVGSESERRIKDNPLCLDAVPDEGGGIPMNESLSSAA